SRFQYTGKAATIGAMRLKRCVVQRSAAERKWKSLGLSAARAALPGIPIAEQFELLVEAGFLDESLEFGPRKALAKRFGAVSDSPGCQRGERGVQLQFAHVHLVQRV